MTPALTELFALQNWTTHRLVCKICPDACGDGGGLRVPDRPDLLCKVGVELFALWKTACEALGTEPRERFQ